MFPISLKSLNDQERHDYILKTFILNQKSSADQRKHKRDIDVIREHHRFLWDDEDDAANQDSWEIRLAKRYYDKLFKEYCIADLTRHRENKIALRWRTEAEVVAGTGQFLCGSRKCTEKTNLRSWEVNFAYKEQGEAKNALVKLRLCPEHSEQLNYTSKKREIKRLKRTEHQNIKKSRRQHKNALKTKGLPNDKGTDEANTSDVSNTDTKEIDSPPKDVAENETSGDEDTNVLDESEDIWSKKPEVELESVSRESEFERYLEDLLL